MLSVIVPLYNERERVAPLVEHLRRLPGVGEVVLADASDDARSKAALAQLAARLTDTGMGEPRIRLVRCPRVGRAAQMNVGAAQCGGEALLFLHCDTRLPTGAAERIGERVARGHAWGWFKLRLDARGAVYRLLERMICLRARLSGIATGDMAMFIQRRVFERERGFAEIALMEDVELSRRLRRRGRPAVIALPATTSARRWQQNGVLRTVLLMWKLRFLYWLGRSPDQLAAVYHHVR